MKIGNFLNNLLYGKKRWQWLFEKMHFISLYGMNVGGGSLFEQSGEEKIVQYLLSLVTDRSFTWVDVGAHNGSYSKMVYNLTRANGLKPIGYLFEPNDRHKNELDAFEKVSGCKIFCCALGGSEGMADFHVMPTDTLSSLLHTGALYPGETETLLRKVPITTLDNVMRDEGVKNIDFLKIDIEGFEYDMLQGCRQLLMIHSIYAIQFEFGRAQIAARHFLKDFFDLLSPDYSIHRVLKDGITPPLTYHNRLEIFQTTNFLALLKDVHRG